jgi:hypothetical protein
VQEVTERLELGQLEVQLYNYEQLEPHGWLVLDDEVRRCAHFACVQQQVSKVARDQARAHSDKFLNSIG